MLIERSSRSDRLRALSRPRRRGPRGSPAHGTAASSQRALSSSEIASPPDAHGALSPRLLSLGAARCSPPRRDAEPPSPPPRMTCRPTGGFVGFVGAHLLLLAAPADSHRFPSCSPRVVVVRPFTPELGAPHHPRSPCRGRCPSPARAELHRQRSRAPAFCDGRVGATAADGNAARALRRCWRMLRPRACSRLRAPSHWHWSEAAEHHRRHARARRAPCDAAVAERRRHGRGVGSGRRERAERLDQRRGCVR